MHRQVPAALSNHNHHQYSQSWQETCFRLLAPLSICLCVGISIRYGFYGDCYVVLGPSSSRLFEANSVFVKQVHVTDTDRKGVALYGFSQKPELSLEERWSVSNYMIVGSYRRKGFFLWLNKGSRIQFELEAEKTSLNQIEVSVIKGERKKKTLLPTNSTGADLFHYDTDGKAAKYVIEEDDRYDIGITNLNPRSSMVVMNVHVSSKMYDSRKAKSMCSTGSGTCHLNLLFPNTQYVVVTTPNNGDLGQWYIEVSFIGRIIAYVCILGVIVVIIVMLLKLLGACNEENHEPEHPGTSVAAAETEPLLPEKVFRLPYGTDEEDGGSSRGSSSEDLYDGKICVICYDMPRNCFFVPCGHCATCQVCANRIMEGETRVCPICRRLIHKVRKVIIP